MGYNMGVPKLSNVIPLREQEGTQSSSKYYMLLSDIKSIRHSYDTVETMVATLTDDKFCIVDDIFGSRHFLYYSDMMKINDINEYDEDQFFILIVNAWIQYRSGKK